MKRIIFLLLAAVALSAAAQNVTVSAVDRPAAEVFRSIVGQTGMNFVYSSDLLAGVKVTVDVKDKPLRKALDIIFKDTGIEYKIKGRNVVLKKKHVAKEKPRPVNAPKFEVATPSADKSTLLEEIVVVSRLESPAVETAEIGARKMTEAQIRNTPVLFGENDVIKALQTQPGVAEGTEGMAGMYVHGGNADENLYMLDNVPLYQVNHFGGLFSAFNSDIIRYVDFFKSSFPAKYDGRLSSFMDVRTRNGSSDGHHGSARIGLTSGAFNISGPIGSRTSYLVGLRRSWFDVLSVPALALINSGEQEEIRFHYYFMDLNAKVSHRFSDKATGFVSVYFGDDYLKTGSKDKDSESFGGWLYDEKYNFHWGNLVAQAGLNYRFSPEMSAEFTAAYTRYFSGIRRHEVEKMKDSESIDDTDAYSRTDNNINDWIFRADFDWHVSENSRLRYGANYVRHSFLPSRTFRSNRVGDALVESRDSTNAYGANEFNIYAEDDLSLGQNIRLNAGVHASLFYIDGKTKGGVSPRLSVNWRPKADLSFKGAYSRTVQYVHQLSSTYLSLPTDQWIPITGSFKPQAADKIAAGAYWQPDGGTYAFSVEAYWKWMHNLVDYRDEYYLRPPLEMWNERIVAGRGTAKGIDVKVEKVFGKLTGHIAYSLAWADRTFAGKNGGHTFPARFDNRHSINILLNWKVSDKVQLNASWTGRSGNRFTLLPQMWQTPDFDGFDSYYSEDAPLRAPVNNYRLPFYHRLDLSCTVNNSRGYWTFSLYNAYCHMNTIGVRRAWRDVRVNGSTVSRPVFQKIKLLPIIPSISYTWLF